MPLVNILPPQRSLDILTLESSNYHQLSSSVSIISDISELPFLLISSASRSCLINLFICRRLPDTNEVENQSSRFTAGSLQVFSSK